MTQDPTCVFCNIIADQAEASVVYRDDMVVVFMDIHPVTPGHMLVVPARHSASLAEMTEEHAGHLFRVGKRIAEGLRQSGLRCGGVNLYLADGTAAGQTVFHSHLHVIPRYRGDGFGFHHPHGYGERSARSDLDETAARIREGLDRTGVSGGS
jgi:diadenosine tetraphosphate (Ap4A) HIT family hydrolase